MSTIELLISAFSIILEISIIVILVTKDSEERKLTKTVALKSLKLKERAIDMQIANTQGFLDGIASGQQIVVQEETSEEEERTPVGYGRGN